MIVAATHGLFVGGAETGSRPRGYASRGVTDSVAQAEHARDRPHVLSIAPLLADAVRRRFTMARDV